MHCIMIDMINHGQTACSVQCGIMICSAKVVLLPIAKFFSAAIAKFVLLQSRYS